MDRSSRFRFLLEAYRAGQLTEDQYAELIHMLQDERLMEDDLDVYLTETYRKEVGDSPVLERTPAKSWVFLRVAATTLFTVGVSLFFYWLISGQQEEPRFLSYETGYGEVKEIVLPDGSSVRMNANTKMQWETNWNKSGIRKILLDGEAFFEVIKTADRAQFLVEGQDFVVNVLGTSFNVHSRLTASQVYLEEGRVVIKENAAKADSIVMKPGELVSFDMDRRVLALTTNASMRSAASWTTGVLNFQNVALGEVLERLTDLYGYDFEFVDSKISERQMYVGVPYGSWETVKSALEMALHVSLVAEGGSKYVIVQNSTK